VLLAKPNAFILYSTLARLPGLALEDQVNSTRLFMRELNRLGITSVIDAGGGFQSYPEHYAVIERLAREDALTVRIAFNLFTQRRGEELDDFRRWLAMATPGRGPTGTDPTWYRHNGAGEMLVFSAADFEHFVEPRPDLPRRWRTSSRASCAARRAPVAVPPARHVRRVDRALPRRVRARRPRGAVRRAALHDRPRGDDHAAQHRPRRGARRRDRGAAPHGVPGRALPRALRRRGGGRDAAGAPHARRGRPRGLGTDATRVASYNPWVALEWLVAGTTVGGTELTPPERRLDRATALRLLTAGSAWFSGEEAHKGTLVPGALADFAVLSADYFAVPEREIRTLSSLLTVVGGRVVHGAGPFAELAPPLPLASPDWSPGHLARPALARDGAPLAPAAGALAARAHGQHGPACGQVHAAPARASTGGHARPAWPGLDLLWGADGCSCFAY
jgi:hypothetical protein